MSNPEPNIEYVRKPIPSKITLIGAGLTSIGLILCIILYFLNPKLAAFGSNVVYTFLMSVGLGSLFLIALEYIAGAVWSVPFRRITEIIAAVIFIAPLFALPALFNMHDVFHWSDVSVIAQNSDIRAKAPYLNSSFFIIRHIVIYLIGILFYFIFIKNSKKQDITKDQNLTKINIRFAALFLPFFAISISVVAIDWIMSLEPHWASTIFGIYYISGTILVALAVTTFAAVILNERGYLVSGLKSDHYYSLGALMFGITNFWAYIAFSQFMLIWYANLPEETFWFLNRWDGVWKFITLGIVFIRFIIPYAMLLSQPSKTNPRNLKIVSLIIIFGHLYDLFWLIMPTYKGVSLTKYVYLEIGFPLLAIGVLLFIFGFISKNKNLTPIGDPKLKRGIDFHL